MTGLKRITAILLALFMVFGMLTGCTQEEQQLATEIAQSALEEASDYLNEEESNSDIEASDSEAVDPKSEDSENDESQKGDLSAGNMDKAASVTEDGSYTSRDEVAAYIHKFGHLPDNFLTKNEAKDLGWESSKGNLGEVAPGMSIGGDRFGNREGLLPDAPGRKYFECDIDGDGGYRGAKRIIFSNDGLVYYTEDHYESFTLLYGEE